MGSDWTWLRKDKGLSPATSTTPRSSFQSAQLASLRGNVSLTPKQDDSLLPHSAPAPAHRCPCSDPALLLQILLPSVSQHHHRERLSYSL
ncbi:Sarcoma Antigen 1 [Manis pentadactyla]|nr:Sarcoma Antigen 1 [Manis pentadactyla]